LGVKAHTKNKYQKLYEKGEEAIQGELDIITIVDDL
jgi:hypothetical protein